MEAASARYAARDRFGAGPFGEAAQTPLQRYIRMDHLQAKDREKNANKAPA